jgi:hypothetical protein
MTTETKTVALKDRDLTALGKLIGGEAVRRGRDIVLHWEGREAVARFHEDMVIWTGASPMDEETVAYLAERLPDWLAERGVEQSVIAMPCGAVAPDPRWLSAWGYKKDPKLNEVYVLRLTASKATAKATPRRRTPPRR